MLKKILVGVLVLAFTSVVAGLVFVWQVGAWNILFPSSQHDITPPGKFGDITPPAVLVFSKTNQFRHKEGIAGGTKAFVEISEELGLSMFATENGAVFNDRDLALFDVVVFLNATGDMLSADQESAFESWLEGGGGWLGVHAAGDGSHAAWSWYMENLIGANFTAHILGPQFQVATVVTEQEQHPLNQGSALTWQAEEEWYSWDASPRGKGFLVTATVDENTYSPVQNLFGSSRNLAMGDHPISWSNCVGNGRSFYTALGHTAEAFENPSFRRQLENALRWLQGGEPCTKAQSQQASSAG